MTNYKLHMILDAVEFACLCKRWQASVGIKIDPEIIGHIYNKYYLPNYDNYKLLELIYELQIARVQILCPWNKKEILAMIKECYIEMPEKTEPSRPTVWQHNAIKPPIQGYNLDTIYIYDTDFEFRTGDIIQLQDKRKYKIEIGGMDEVYDTLNVYLIDLETMAEQCITAEEFVQILDNDPDVTILQNIDKHYFIPIL